jgi:hypothetical protein
MKKILANIVLIFLSIYAFGQATVKAWAYEQDSLSGTRSTAHNGNDKAAEKAAGINYLIFISHSKNLNVMPVEIFIKGTGYKVGMIQIKKTPVVIVNNNLPSNPVKTELVPLTDNKVLRLKTGSLLSTHTSNAALKKLIATNDVVIVYVRKGKRYFIPVKEIVKLEPVFNE